MKICIVTVHNSMNYGAYLQAYVLYNKLKELGHEICFLETGARNPLRVTLKAIIKNGMQFKFKQIYFEIRKYIQFKKSIKQFNIIKNELKYIKSQDIFVFGSDEIWNTSRSEINNYPILFGVGITDAYLVSYAPSINKTTTSEIKNNFKFVNSVKRFNKLSVRDDHSKEVLKEVFNKDIDVVLDPTFLFDKDKYKNIEVPSEYSNYILIYGYSNRFTTKYINEIIKFAERKKLKLISIGSYFKWCHKNIAGSPFDFLSYVRNAEFIITNTFHGTIFSIIYNKQFATYVREQNKVKDILKKLNLNKRDASKLMSLDDIFKEEINYENVKLKLSIDMERSLKYIHDFLKSAEETNRGNFI